MSAVSGSQESTALLIVALLVIFLARRTYAMTQGTQYSAARTYAFGIFSAIVFVAFGAGTIYVAVRHWGTVALGLVAPYAAIVVAIAWLTAPHVQARVHFESRPNGGVYYRLPAYIPMLTVVLFVVRIAVEIVFLGWASISSFTVPLTIPTSTLYVLIGFDLLYGASVGLLFGRGIGIRRAYAAAFPSPAPPLP